MGVWAASPTDGSGDALSCMRMSAGPSSSSLTTPILDRITHLNFSWVPETDLVCCPSAICCEIRKMGVWTACPNKALTLFQHTPIRIPKGPVVAPNGASALISRPSGMHSISNLGEFFLSVSDVRESDQMDCVRVC